MEIKANKKIQGVVEISCDADHFLRRKDSTGITDTHFATIPEKCVDDWEEVAVAEALAARETEEREAKYKEDVVSRIRTRYSADDENAILRKMMALSVPRPQLLADESDDTQTEHDPEAVLSEFVEYDRFVEQCKAEAKAEVLATEPDTEKGGAE